MSDGSRAQQLELIRVLHQRQHPERHRLARRLVAGDDEQREVVVEVVLR